MMSSCAFLNHARVYFMVVLHVFNVLSYPVVSDSTFQADGSTPVDIVSSRSFCVYQRELNDTTGNGTVSSISSFIGTFNVRNMICSLMTFYNEWTGFYTTKTGDLAKRVSTTKSRVESMIQDVDDVIHTVNEKTKHINNDKADQLNDLLLLTIMERENIRNKMKTSYSVLECGNILGKDCVRDDDCVYEGCQLHCKTTGSMWWRKRSRDIDPGISDISASLSGRSVIRSPIIMLTFKLHELINLQNFICLILCAHLYEHWAYYHAKKALSLSRRLETSKTSVDSMIQELDSIIQTLQNISENVSEHKQSEVNTLLQNVTTQRNNWLIKIREQYGILECRQVLGRECLTDDDCITDSCSLRCKTSGYVVWGQYICR